MHQNGPWHVVKLQKEHFPNSAAFIHLHNFYFFAQTFCSWGHLADCLKVPLSWVPETPLSEKVISYAEVILQHYPFNPAFQSISLTVVSSFQKSSLLSELVWDKNCSFICWLCRNVVCQRPGPLLRFLCAATKQATGIWEVSSGSNISSHHSQIYLFNPVTAVCL